MLFFPLIILSQTSEEVPTLLQEINGIKIGVPKTVYVDGLPIFQDFRISDNSTCESCVVWRNQNNTAIAVHTLTDYTVKEFVDSCDDKNEQLINRTYFDKDYYFCIDTYLVGNTNYTSVFTHNNTVYQVTVITGSTDRETENEASRIFGFVFGQIIKS